MTITHSSSLPLQALSFMMDGSSVLRSLLSRGKDDKYAHPEHWGALLLHVNHLMGQTSEGQRADTCRDLLCRGEPNQCLNATGGSHWNECIVVMCGWNGGMGFESRMCAHDQGRLQPISECRIKDGPGSVTHKRVCHQMLCLQSSSLTTYCYNSQAESSKTSVVKSTMAKDRNERSDCTYTNRLYPVIRCCRGFY